MRKFIHTPELSFDKGLDEVPRVDKVAVIAQLLTRRAADVVKGE